MLKRVAADAIEFRELYFSMDPRFRDWEHEKTIDQVWEGILSGKTDALEAGDHFRRASIIEVGIAGAWFPLTRKVVLMMQKSLLPGVTTVSGSLAREINRRVMACAERRIYAGENSPHLQKAFERHGCKVPVESLDFRYEI